MAEQKLIQPKIQRLESIDDLELLIWTILLIRPHSFRIGQIDNSGEKVIQLSELSIEGKDYVKLIYRSSNAEKNGESVIALFYEKNLGEAMGFITKHPSASFIKKTLSLPHTKVCGLFGFSGCSEKSDICKATVCTINGAVYFSDIKKYRSLKSKMKVLGGAVLLEENRTAISEIYPKMYGYEKMKSKLDNAEKLVGGNKQGVCDN